jgi:hypothetical protein
MTELHLPLTAAEYQILVEFLEEKLKETEIEEHRTRTLTYRENVTRQEEAIKSVLNKLRRLAPPATAVAPGTEAPTAR